MPKNKKSKRRDEKNDHQDEAFRHPESYDPDGTHDVHRGLTNKEARTRRHNLIQELEAKTKARQANRHSQQSITSSIYDDGILTTRPKKKLAQDKVLRQKLQQQETRHVEAKIRAMDAHDILHTGQVGLLEAEHEMERTTALSQVTLKRQLQGNDTARHIYDLSMDSPHGLKYDRSGRFALLYSTSINPQGHVAIMDCHTRSLIPEGEFYLQQNIRDSCFLHHAQMLAVAPVNQPVAIYDNTGVEIHALQDHIDPLSLEFLPHHFLLASLGRNGFLKYTDTTTGQLISTHRTRGAISMADKEKGIRPGQPCVMRQNPANAILHVGHTNGTVTLWSPASSQYLVKMLCHKGASVLSIAMDLAGRTMATGGADRQVKVFDLRNTFQPLHSYYTLAGPATSLDISQQGLLGIGHAGHATFWSASALQVKEKDPYMHHMIPQGGPIETLRFRPFEDVCGIGHAKGISSIVIPGSGEPNLDTSEYHTNPFQDKKQRQEAEVRALLDKLRPEMITLDPEAIGGMENQDDHARLEQLRDKQEAANAKPGVVKKEKNKKRGRSKIQTKLRRKNRTIVDKQTLQLREAREQEKAQMAAESKAAAGVPVLPSETPKDQAPAALKRFFG